MDGMLSGLCCTLLLWAFQVCHGAIEVTVPAEVEVIKGETAKLQCSFTGADLSSAVVEWSIENQGVRTRLGYRSKSGEIVVDSNTPLTGRVSIENDLTLTISDVKISDDHPYNCQVVAGAQGSKDKSTMLKVFFSPEAPELKTPSSQFISVKSPTSSEIGTCVAKNGHPQPRIIWFKNDSPIPEEKDRNKETYMVPSVVKEASGLFTIKSILFMRPTKADKDSAFYCVVEYKMPKTGISQKKSNVIKINLNYPPEKAFLKILNPSPVKEGDTVEMKCETDGNPQPEFEFFKNKDPIKGNQGGLLTLKSVKRDASGPYKCSGLDFDNPEIDLTASLNLVVNYIDLVSITPATPQVVEFGKQVEMQCQIKASGESKIQWKKGTAVLTESGSLSLQTISYKDAGQYTCVGSVPSVPGLTTQRTVNITVEGKPEIAAPFNGEVGQEGEEVTLKCSAYGYPPPQFTWNHPGAQSVAVVDNMVVSSLTLKATADVMKDGVKCEVTNIHGTESQTVPVALKRSIDNSAEADMQQGGSSVVVIAVVVCVLLLLLLVALILFVSRKNNACSKRDKKDIATTDRSSTIVMEMKSEKGNEEAGLLNKKVPTEQ